MPGYVNTIKPKTKVVVFIAEGKWGLTHPIPRISRNVHIVGSATPGREEDFAVDLSKGEKVAGGTMVNRVGDYHRLRESMHLVRGLVAIPS